MATKKLTVELDAQTAKAQQQIRKAVEGATAEAAAPGGGIGGGAKLDLAAERTAKSFEKLDRTAEGFDKRMLSVTRAFAGLAVGMATSYASRYFAEGSGARKAMDYGGAAITGASAGMTAGMALGPYGAAAGAIIGGLEDSSRPGSTRARSGPRRWPSSRSRRRYTKACPSGRRSWASFRKALTWTS